MKCTKCNKVKSSNEFYKRKNRPSPCSECKDCFKQRMSNRHQLHKDTLVKEFGGKCSICGYNKYPRILHFHHLNSENKEFGISIFLSSNLNKLREEAKKCILLCPNCHMEQHCSTN